MSNRPPAWKSDPWNAHLLRYWDGSEWTGHTAPRFEEPPVRRGWFGRRRATRFRPSGHLVSATYKMLFADTSIVVMMLLGGVLAAAAALAVAAPAMIWGHVTPAWTGHGLSGALVAACALGVSTFVIQLVTGAVCAAAMLRADGRSATAREALAVAWTRRRQMLAWALVSTLVGAITRVLERFGAGGIIGALTLNLGWAAATVFAVPVIMVEGTMPIPTIRRSSTLLKQQFGTTVISNISLAVPWLAGLFVAFGTAFAGAVVITFGSGEVVPVVVGATCVILGCVGAAFCMVVSSALSTFLQTYIYRYANGMTVPGIDPAWLPARPQP